ncbi:transcriptional regulator with XRE-family HTH domain [Devosia sp. UYZn731]|uniref:helix-turn-helix transcriptional regulator n=1 Tax=Devosia sp. UYZn731 TaxID=3156345 RepID=UPI00339AC38D
MLVPRTYSHLAADAAAILGKQIRLARKQRKMTEADFAERVGIARSTLRAIEGGSLKSEIGLVFEAAFVAGVDLFRDDGRHLVPQLARLDDKLALLPRRVRTAPAELKDDF